MERVQGQLKLDIRMDDAVDDWIVKNYDKSAGADAINSLFNDFYVGLWMISRVHSLGIRRFRCFVHVRRRRKSMR